MTNKIECKKCKTKVDWMAQMKEWNEQYGDAWEGDAMICIICPKCSSYVMGIDLYEMEDGEDIESPALKSKVKMPKPKKSKKVAVYKPKLKK